jgi:hypothetical protein
MTPSLKREIDAKIFVLNFLNWYIPAAMAEYRAWKKEMLKQNHRFWKNEIK